MEGQENDEQVRDEVRSEETNSLISSLCYFFHQLLKFLFKCFGYDQHHNSEESEQEIIINGVENTNVASSSSSPISQKHEVFLSFRGEDTRAKFTSHLEKRLRDKKVETFIDNRLEKGDNISDALIEAIRSSKMSVIIFSVNYATSSWCLDEVLCILECMKERGQIVIPVFYEVDPSHVRKQSGTYEAAFAKLKKRFEEKKLSQWRAALTQVANLSGFPSQQYGTDSDFIDAIVEDILKKLKDMSSGEDHFKDLVGIDESVKGIKKLLQLDSRDVRIIGIWGMGGLGKTTLARVIFKRLSSNFEGCCFLKNVREKSEKLYGLEEVNRELVSDLLGEKDLQEIRKFHEERLRCKKVLIVLDDVDKLEQLQKLAEDHSWFGRGSRVIITTRDEDVLRDRVDCMYKLERLNKKSALELFKLNAFKKNSPTDIDNDLLERVVKLADGIPLALRVLGSFLRSKKRKNWEHEIEKLKKFPIKDIQDVLRISYEGLDERQQRVFLDIVCFVYSGLCRHYVERKLGGGKWLEAEIDNLIAKSLIIEEDGRLSVHDLIRDMGREIVRQESKEEPGERSRLWNENDCYQVFQNNSGTKTIQGLLAGPYSKEVKLSPAVFNKMCRLRFLEIRFSSLQLPAQQLECLPSAINYLEWYDWPFECMPIDFSPDNLVVLRMPRSKLKRLWSGDKKLGNLKHVDLNHSTRLTDVSALSLAPNLESVDLSNCYNLCEVPSLKFGDSHKNNHKCDYWKCTTLGHLNLSECNSVNVIGSISGNVKELTLAYSPIRELPSSVFSLKNLTFLDLSRCRSLRNIPSNIQKLTSLKRLDLCYCTSFEVLPRKLPRSLTWLNLSDTAIEEVPSESIENLSSLDELNLSYCKKLKHLPTNICKMKSLKRLTIDHCKQLEIFPEILEPMECLEVLSLNNTGNRVLPSSIENLTRLRELRVSPWNDDHFSLEKVKHESSSTCQQKLSVPGVKCARNFGADGVSRDSNAAFVYRESSPWKTKAKACSVEHSDKTLTILRELSVPGTHLTGEQPCIFKLKNLTTLELGYWNVSEIPNEIGDLSCLEVLCLRENPIREIPLRIQKLCKLKRLHILDCKSLRSLPELPLSVELVYAGGCSELRTVSNSRDVIPWNDPYRITRPWIFLCFNCPLDQNTLRGIVNKFWHRVMLFKYLINVNVEELGHPDVAICFPGYTIPEDFTHNSEKDRIEVDLPTQWHNADFLGFVLCIIVDEFTFDTTLLDKRCYITFETNNGQRYELDWNLNVKKFDWSGTQGKHVLMWYKYMNYSEYRDAVKVTLYFQYEYRFEHEYYETKCGFRLLYRGDYMNNNVGPSANINSDTNEPQPKRLRLPDIRSDVSIH